MTRHVPALIVGGGISGLVCAHALRKAGMWNFKAGLGMDEIAVKEDVEVEGARAIGDGHGAITTEEPLDEKEGGE